MSSQLTDQYEQGIDKLRQSIRGLLPEDLTWVPPADAGVGLWSIQQILVHLQDAETAFADRVRRIVAEDNPPLMAWSENRFSERLHYADQSADDAIQLIALIRKQLSRVLRKLTPADFQRAGTHSEAGRQTVTDVLAKAVWHLEHHMKFIHEKRAKMGKEMW